MAWEKAMPGLPRCWASVGRWRASASRCRTGAGRWCASADRAPPAGFGLLSQPPYWTMILVKSYGFWVTFEQVPGAQGSTTPAGHWKSRLTDQNENQAGWFACAKLSSALKSDWRNSSDGWSVWSFMIWKPRCDHAWLALQPEIDSSWPTASLAICSV